MVERINSRPGRRPGFEQVTDKSATFLLKTWSQTWSATFFAQNLVADQVVMMEFKPYYTTIQEIAEAAYDSMFLTN